MSCEDEMYPILTFYNDSDADIHVAIVDVTKCDSASQILFHGRILLYEIVENGTHKVFMDYRDVNYYFETMGSVNVSAVKYGDDGYEELLWHRQYTKEELQALNWTVHYPPTENKK